MPAAPLEAAPSPYLRLHQDNLVQWRLWSPETLAEAASSGKPLFVSVGYGSCHWCHVLAREGFNNPEIASLLNDNYIPVLVDSEERPDIDMLYQAAANLMGHSGGWPLNILALADGSPYFASGYLPNEERGGQPALGTVLAETTERFKSRPQLAIENATQIKTRLQSIYDRDLRSAPESIMLDTASMRVAQRFDIFFGGLTGEPKFPGATTLELVWRAFLRTGAPQYSQLLFNTLDQILFGGLYDHVGGGFFRYVVDERWLVPHFEKMLYDSALLVDVLSSLWQYNRAEICRMRVKETIAWLLREMKLPDGGFATGLDADSEGEDGKYYIWSEAEIDAALSGTFAAKFKAVHEVSRDGNYRGRNILRRTSSKGGPISDADEALFARQRELLLAARNKRTPPRRDDKLVADMNGLAIAAIANAGAVFERQDWIAEAVAAFDQVVRTLGEGDLLHHAAYDGARTDPGFASDYANMARAALQLYEVTGDKRFIDKAKAWAFVLDNNFWDEARGGFFYTPDTLDAPVIRMRMVYDQPVPSANGVMLTVLTRLVMLTGDAHISLRANQLLRSFGAEVPRAFVTMGAFLNGAEYYSSALQIVVFGPRSSARTQELIRAVWGKALPNRLIIQVEPGENLPLGHPAAEMGTQNSQPTAYICQGIVCSPPFQSAVTLSQTLTLPQQQKQQVA